MADPYEFTHRASANLDYTTDWSKWLAVGETITDAVWVVQGADADLTISDQSATSVAATVWLTAGTPSLSYPVSVTITTSGGRVDTRTLKISVVAP